MTALQLHYTSCRAGYAGRGPGFQTRNRSEGITPDEQADIERMGSFKAPSDLPSRPDRDEILRSYPRAFRFFRMGSGRMSILLSCYSGQDYSQRWGNYFSHALVLDEIDRWAIDFYEWSGWVDQLEESEDTEEAPPPLGEVSLQGIPHAESFSFDELGAFLQESPERPEILARMIRAVFLRAETDRILLIRDAPLEALYWIACIQKAFSVEIAREISFSTYQHGAMNAASINATTGETDFNFDATSRDYQFYIFDLQGSMFSEIPQEGMDYAGILARWMSESPERVMAFHRWVQQTSFRQLDSALLLDAAIIFGLPEDGPAELDLSQFERIVKFAEAFQTEATREHFRRAIQHAQGAVKDTGGQKWRLVFRYLMTTAREEVERRQLCRVWLQLFEGVVLQQNYGHDWITQLYQSLQRERNGFQKLLAETILAKPPQDRIDLSQCSAQTLDLLLQITVDSLTGLERSPILEQPEVHPVIDAILASEPVIRSLPRVLLSFDGHPKSIVFLTTRFAEPEAPQERLSETSSALVQVLDRCSVATRRAVRGELEQQGRIDLLYGEWSHRLQAMRPQHSNAQVVEFWNGYRQEVLEGLPAFREGVGLRIQQDIFQVFDDPSRLPLALDWIRSGQVRVLVPEVRTASIHLVHRAIPDLIFNRKQRWAQIGPLIEAFNALVKNPPPWQLLIQALERPLIAKKEEHEARKQLRLAIKQTSVENFRRFLCEFLSPALSQVRSGADHHRLLVTIGDCPPKQEEAFKKEYSLVMKQLARDGKAQDVEYCLRSWIQVGTGPKPPRGLQRWPMELSLELMAELSQRDRTDIDERLMEELEGPAKNLWSRKREKLPKSTLSRLTGGLFSRSKSRREDEVDHEQE